MHISVVFLVVTSCFIFGKNFYLSIDSVPTVLPAKVLYTFLIRPMRATFPAHLTLLHLDICWNPFIIGLCVCCELSADSAY